MSEFKPMVKMYTDEPSVSLKLKKGGHVHHKSHKQHEEHGHKAMHHGVGGHMHGAHHAFESEHGKAPKRPSASDRRKAMNPQMYKKGGGVHHKMDGGVMPAAAAPVGVPAAAAPGMIRPMARPAIVGMTPAQRLARAAMVRRALTGMKKGGSTHAECAKLEQELKHHEALSASKAHGKHHKASGGKIDAAETRTTIKGNAGKFDKTKMDTSHKDAVHGTGEVKEGKPGGYKLGGAIEGNEGKFKNTKMNDGDHNDPAHGTGGVRMSNAGGFKHGGKMHHKASGGAIDSKLTKTTIEGGNWENRPADTARPGKANTKTGEVKESNAGGFRKGGAAKNSYATGGNVVDDGKAVKMPHHFVSQPVANSLQSGTFKRGGKVEEEEKPNLRLLKTHTGPKGHVAKVYKDRDWDEHRVKFFSPEGKHLAAADYHTDDLSDAHDTAMSEVNKGYKRGGKAKMADGGKVPSDAASQIKTSDADRAYKNWERGEMEDNESMRESILGAPRRAYQAIKGMFGSTPPAGSVTKTEKSVTVSPGKKRGGKC